MRALTANRCPGRLVEVATGIDTTEKLRVRRPPPGGEDVQEGLARFFSPALLFALFPALLQALAVVLPREVTLVFVVSRHPTSAAGAPAPASAGSGRATPRIPSWSIDGKTPGVEQEA